MGNQVSFYKDKSEDVWFVGIYSNNFEDREEEILSWKAHEDFAAWVKAKGINLPIIMLHQPAYPGDFHLIHLLALEKGLITAEEYSANLRALYKSTSIAESAAVIPLNGFMMVIGKVFPHRMPLVDKLLARKSEWGMSHGFVKIKYDDNIIDKYRSFEFTLAPDEWAANGFTPIGFSKDGKAMDEDVKLSEENRELVEEFLGLDADELDEGTKKLRTIMENIINHKAVAPEESKEEEAEEDVTAAPEYGVLRDKIFNDLDVKGLVKALKEFGEAQAAQGTQLTQLSAALKELQRSDDEKIAREITPDWTLGFMSPGETGADDPALVKQLTEDKDRQIVEDKTVTEGDENMLQVGLWDVLLPGGSK